jgi:predicted porin
MQAIRKQGQVRAIAAVLAVACGAGASADALAIDNVQIYGLIGSYVGSIKRSDSIDRTTVVGSGGLTTSYLGFRGDEDLGGGLHAMFQLENFFQPDTGGAGRSASDPTAFSRSAWVGLKGRFGQVSIGRHTSPYYVSMQLVNPFGSSVVFSPLVVQSYVGSFSNTVIGDTVWNNAIQYVAPDIGNLNVTAIYAPGEKTGDSSVSNLGLHLRYRQGPLTAVLSGQRMRTAALAPSTGQYAYLAGLSYDFGPVKLYGSAQATDNAVTDVTSRTGQLGASVPVTAKGAILVSWARTTVDNPKLAIGTHNTAALGYDYNLSRRTDVYATYLYDHINGRVVGNSYATGIRHTF